MQQKLTYKIKNQQIKSEIKHIKSGITTHGCVML